MPDIQKLFRAVSKKELKDWNDAAIFRTAFNTLEAKRFFKTKNAVEDFIYHARQQNFTPPYTHIFEIDILKQCLTKLKIPEMILDRFDAISVDEEHLPDFNKCIKFVQHYAI